MIYIDKTLCSGCGLCVDECRQGAITLSGATAAIDADLCTSCGRCVEACPAGAIVLMEVDPVDAALPQANYRQTATQQMLARPPRVPAPTDAKQSRFETLERVLSGLFGIAGYALDHDLIPRRRSSADRASKGGGLGRTSARSGTCARGGRGRRNRRSAPGGGRGGDRCRSQRKDRSC